MSSLLEADDSSQPGPSAVPHASTSSPIASWQQRRAILDVPTEILVQVYDDRILVIITQNDKLGSLVQASLPPMFPLPHPHKLPSTNTFLVLPPPPESISLLTLIGSPPNPNLHSIYVSQIATLVWWALQEVQADRRPVVVGLTLAKSKSGQDEEDEMDQSERERFMSIMSLVAEWPGPSPA